MKLSKETIDTAADKGTEYVKKQSWPKWVKIIAVGAIAAAAAVASMTMTSCTITPEQANIARSIQSYVIKVEPSDCK